MDGIRKNRLTLQQNKTILTNNTTIRKRRKLLEMEKDRRNSTVTFLWAITNDAKICPSEQQLGMWKSRNIQNSVNCTIGTQCRVYTLVVLVLRTIQATVVEWFEPDWRQETWRLATQYWETFQRIIEWVDTRQYSHNKKNIFANICVFHGKWSQNKQNLRTGFFEFLFSEQNQNMFRSCSIRTLTLTTYDSVNLIWLGSTECIFSLVSIGLVERDHTELKLNSRWNY